jgi:RNA polymerase sigma factor (sigma-70 family)
VHCIKARGVFILERDSSVNARVNAMDDQVLLSQYVANGDKAAFEELTRRYSSLVRGVCLQILGNSHDAEEVSQECFFEFARHSAEVHTSIGGWLHRTATSRSLNVIRSRSRRKVRERACSLTAEASTPPEDLTERDLHRLIQGALKELPEDLRLPMVLHYVDGQSQRDVAVKLGVNQSTISRRMQDALRQLRDKLTQAGYAATAPAMMALMQKQAVAGTTDRPLAEIVVSESAGKLTAGATLASYLKGIATVFLPTIGFLLWDGWLSLIIAICLSLYVARSRPAWLERTLESFGWTNLYQRPTFFLKKWNWTVAPDRWQTQARSSLLWSSVFLAIAALFAFGTNNPPTGTVALALLVAAVFLAQTGRLWHRATVIQKMETVKNVPTIDRFPAATSIQSPISDPICRHVDAFLQLTIGLAGVIGSIVIVSRSRSDLVWPALTLCATLGTAMLVSGARQFYQQLTRSRSSSDPVQIENAADTPSKATTAIVVIGATIVASLSAWIFSNTAAFRSSSMTLAAVQTLMLSWMVYRITVARQQAIPRFASRLVIAILAACFLLNSGTCLANWFPQDFRL